MELLLYLVRRDGVDLRDVAIAPITDAYLMHVEMMEALDIDVAGEFLVLASSLCYLKSLELMPKVPFSLDEEEDDPDVLRDELVRKLQDYQRYSDAADELQRRPWLGREVFARPTISSVADEQALDPGADAIGLLQIFAEMLERHAAPPPVHHVQRDSLSIEDMAQWVLDRICDGPRELTDLLRHFSERSERVFGLVATLELARLGALDIRQRHHLGPVVIQSTGPVDAMVLNVLCGSA